MPSRLDQQEDTLSRVYGAALAPGRWNEALASIAAEISAGSAYFFSAHSDVDRTAVSYIHNLPQELPTSFLEHWHTQDVFDQAARRLGVTPGQVVLGSELVPTRELMKTGYYQDFARPHGMEALIGAQLFNGREGDCMPVTHLCWYRPPGQEHFSVHHRERLCRIVPHFQRALRLQRKLSWFSDAGQTGAFEAMYVAAIELNRQGGILRTNGAARQFLDTLPAGCVRFGTLRSLGSRCAPAILDALAVCTSANPVRMTACLPGPSPQVVAGTLVSVDGAHPESIHYSGGGRYLLLVELPKARGHEIARSVSALFGLTAAEARVLGELLEGKSPAGISETCGTSLPTVRTQISSILAKTGTKSQIELLLLLRSLRF